MISLVTIETRLTGNLIQNIQKHLDKIRQPYNLVVFGSSDNANAILSAFPDCSFYKWIENSDYTEAKYNQLLTSPKFWDLIPDENVLIFHQDSEILIHGIERFFEWDYVGAPWINPEWGGNGGLSIRKKSVMLKCIEIQPEFDRWSNEDGYFCDIMLKHKIGKLAPREVCEKFACETIFKLGTYGAHNIDKYLTSEQCSQIRNQYKDVWIIGKGPSILNLKKEQIGKGLVLCINDSIKIIEDLGLENEIWAMFKDGASPTHPNNCPYRTCDNCPFGFVRPKKAKLWVHKHESMDCYTDYPDREVFDNEELGLIWRQESVMSCIELALRHGYNMFHFIGFDSVTSKNVYDYKGTGNGGYLVQAERLKERVKTLNYEFI